MQIDCKDLPCPQPVLNTKQALETIDNEGVLEVLVNSNAAKENIMRYASNYGYEIDVSEENQEITLFIKKGILCDAYVPQEPKALSNIGSKTLFIKTNRVGDGELGVMLMAGFIGNIIEQERLPKKIILVNEGVLLTTAASESDVVQSLQALEQKGVEVYSCGMCLKHFDVEEALKVGKVGNAYETVHALLNEEVVSL